MKAVKGMQVLVVELSHARSSYICCILSMLKLSLIESRRTGERSGQNGPDLHEHLRSRLSSLCRAENS